MSALTDLAVSAIIKAISSDPKSTAKLHAAVMLHGKDHLEKSFNESEPFTKWRETQRTIGRVEELLWITKRLARVVDRFVELEEESLAEEFVKFKDKLTARAKKLADPLLARGVEVEEAE